MSTCDHTEAKLNELDKTEWFDVCKCLNPNLTPEEFEPMWVEFQIAKSAYQRQQALH